MTYESINAYSKSFFEERDIDPEDVAVFFAEEMPDMALVRRYDEDYSWELLKVE